MYGHDCEPPATSVLYPRIHTVSRNPALLSEKTTLDAGMGSALQRGMDDKPLGPFVACLSYFSKRFTEIGRGRQRAVFAKHNSTNIVKVPWNDSGIWANFKELQPDNWLGDKERYARVWKDERYSKMFGFEIIRMERVTPVKTGFLSLPSWCGAVDGYQVGHTASGALVAFDWG